MYLWTGEDQTCMLTTDWNDPNDPMAGASGFYVSEDPEAGSCPFIEEYGYTYAAYTMDEETGQPISITGPWGNEWMFKDPEVFAEDHPEWYYEFVSAWEEEQSGESSSEGTDPVWYQFIVNEDHTEYAVVATWDEEFEVFYLWTPDNNTCKLSPDWKTDNKEDNIWGFYVSYEEGYSCRFIEENEWTYASYTYDNETMDPVSIVGPWGNEWSFMTPEDF